MDNYIELAFTVLTLNYQKRSESLAGQVDEHKHKMCEELELQ